MNMPFKLRNDKNVFGTGVERRTFGVANQRAADELKPYA